MMLYLHGLGHFHPENVINNSFLEQLDIGTNNQWILERVGIQSRRTVLPLEYITTTRNTDPRMAREAAIYSNAETGKRAAEIAIQNAGISKNDIGMVIAGGCSPDTVTPAEACTIAAALGIEAPAFDLNSACSTFGAHLHWLSNMASDSMPEFVLIVQPENNTRTVNYNDRGTAVLWGDGTCAAIVSTKVKGRARVTFSSLTSDPLGWNKVIINGRGHFWQDGRAVQTFAIKKTSQYLTALRDKHPDRNEHFYFIGHQANLRMLQSVCRRCEIAAPKHLYNVDRLGNTGAAGAPTVLSQNWQRFEAGDEVALVVVGAGLTWASSLVEFL